MSEQDIIAGMIALVGQSQDERTPVELDPGYAQIDERDTDQLLADVRALAAKLPYTSANGATGTWGSMLDKSPAELAALAKRGQVPPHLALLLAFAEMYQLPRALQNGVAARHLDFHQRRVLGLETRPAKPDRTHALLKLKKGMTNMAITPADRFSAGKDDTGVELLYTPTATTIINRSSIASLRSIFLDSSEGGRIRHAPIADSADGLGAKLSPLDPSWPAFGSTKLEPAEIGFAIASPLLRLAGGERTIEIELELVGGAALTDERLRDTFDLSLTGEQGWLGPYTPTLRYTNSKLTISYLLPAATGAVVDYTADVHGGSYTTSNPIARLLVLTTSKLGYLELAPITVSSVQIDVTVDGLQPTTLDNDYGKLKPGKPFVAFGPEPLAGARLEIGCPEALSKPLRALSLTLTWKAAPKSFSDLYKSYKPVVTGNGYFRAGVAFEDSAGWGGGGGSRALFDPDDAGNPHTLTFQVDGDQKDSYGDELMRLLMLMLLRDSGSLWAFGEVNRQLLSTPSVATRAPAPLRSGVVVLELEQGFRHAEYRKHQLELALRLPQVTELPDVPYTPTVQSLSLSYRASSGAVQISSPTDIAFSHPNAQFFHHDCFGQRREHGYLRDKFPEINQKRVPLLPEHTHAGELLIGVADLQPGEAVSMLLQLAEGSADPQLPRAKVEWSVLIDGYWTLLRDGARGFDSTNSLVASGIVSLVPPAQTTTQSTLLPTGLLWLRATVDNVDAVCRFLSVDTNAVELRFEDRGNSPTHLRAALPAGSIKKLVAPRAELKSVKQPYASFGGAPAETDKSFHTRVSERLRHKQRAIMAWDYERIVLEAFPEIYRVKCIPHSKPGNWLAPGHVTLLVVPDLRNRSAYDMLHPQVDADTLTRIADYMVAHAGISQRVWVRNPVYEQVQLKFEVCFQTGREFNYHRAQLEHALIRVLSPWAFEPEKSLRFGASVYRSQLLHFVERLDYVDYVRRFEMHVAIDTHSSGDIRDARPSTPAAVLVSASSHYIVEVRASAK